MTPFGEPSCETTAAWENTVLDIVKNLSVAGGSEQGCSMGVSCTCAGRLWSGAVQLENLRLRVNSRHSQGFL